MIARILIALIIAIVGGFLVEKLTQGILYLGAFQALYHLGEESWKELSDFVVICMLIGLVAPIAGHKVLKNGIAQFACTVITAILVSLFADNVTGLSFGDNLDRFFYGMTVVAWGLVSTLPLLKPKPKPTT